MPKHETQKPKIDVPMPMMALDLMYFSFEVERIAVFSLDSLSYTALNIPTGDSHLKEDFVHLTTLALSVFFSIMFLSGNF